MSTKNTFSCREPAERTVTVKLSAAELAAVLLFHTRQRKRIAVLAGEIATGENPNLTPSLIGTALEECQDQRAAHQARAFELSHLLRTNSAKGTAHN